MKMLVILTAQVRGATVQIVRDITFNAGATRTRIYQWALTQAGLDQMSQDEYAVTFFYAEPDEVTA